MKDSESLVELVANAISSVGWEVDFASPPPDSYWREIRQAEAEAVLAALEPVIQERERAVIDSLANELSKDHDDEYWSQWVRWKGDPRFIVMSWIRRAQVMRGRDASTTDTAADRTEGDTRMTEAYAPKNEPEACPRCWGSGKIASDDARSPWPVWGELEPPANLAVQLGVVVPLPCPDCGETGKQVEQ